MVFISSLIPFDQLETLEEAHKTGWFLFSDRVRNKNVRVYNNDELDSMLFRLGWYPWYYTESPLYCYLMSDRYYYKSKFFHNNQTLTQSICMRKVPHSLEDDWRNPGKYQRIDEHEHVCTKEDINCMFEIFAQNNYREKPICEVILRR